ncbi:carbohydrate ABC transporter permease [Bifidobacterium avesanii]|uniref:ABC transporter permease subunit n=1 Tax=Bifidobacterium avesanii TaxID=1798157 RepID=A0A7K3TIU8_9BIFI|nr:carbohydrate ABC transporter permease [Bifidobacterium avesanii]KAB8291925.1 ABC transporter permease [Bifidobacterium avesanii]NEG79027.1 ABC transporter permease subunit [Bifidobacterium avesanii]
MSSANRSASLRRRDAKLAAKDHKLRERKKAAMQSGIPVELTPTQKVMNVLIHVVMLLMVVYCLIPLVWLMFSSTKTNEDLYTSNGMWFGKNMAFWQNIVDTFTFEGGIYPRWLLNTLVYAVVAGLGATLFATFAGYAIATMRFHGRKALLWITLIFMSIPATVITVPLFLLYSKIGLTGTPWAVILPQLSNPFGLYLMIIYAQTSIPISLVEAARIDGANTWTIFWKIAFPLLSPGFVTTLLFALVGVWNNYFLPLIMLNDVRDYPLTVGLNVWMKMAGDASYHVVPNNMILTGSLVAIVPLIIAFLFLQKYWQSGLAAGAVKQ